MGKLLSKKEIKEIEETYGGGEIDQVQDDVFKLLAHIETFEERMELFKNELKLSTETMLLGSEKI